MMVDEFESIFVAAGLINDNFVGRDAYISFNSAMMTQVDELNKDRHLKGVFVEFLEGFGRACEKMSLPPFPDETVRVFNKIWSFNNLELRWLTVNWLREARTAPL